MGLPPSRPGASLVAVPARGAVAVAVVLALAAAGCDAPTDVTGRLLEQVPVEAEVVVAIMPAQVAGTWLDRTVSALAEGPVPACVLEAARTAPVVVVAWGDDGALILLAGTGGGAAARCPELERRRDDRAWAGGLVATSGRQRFFAERARRDRWAGLAAAPVRAIADVELALGVTVRARGTADPRAGLTARLAVETDDRPTLLALRDRYLRWRGGLDHERLGAAWPAIAAITTVEDRADARRSTDIVEVRLPGDDGATAAALAIGALASGLGGSSPRLPCPDNLGDFTGRAACDDGELTLTEELFDELGDDPSVLTAGVQVVPATHQGAFAGYRLDALSATDPLTWLGFVNGDVIDAIDGRPFTSADQITDIFRAATSVRELELGVTRRGRRGTLRFRVR